MNLPAGPAWLFVPGDRPDRWSKAQARSDGVIVDLENAVGLDDKSAARRLVSGATGTIDTGCLVVRINAPGTPWFEDDLAMVRESDIQTVMLPKITGADSMRRASEELAGRGIVALCETAVSIVEAREIGEVDGCVALFWGGEDLTVDLGGTTSRDESGVYHPFIQHVRASTRLAARASDVAAVDAPTLLIDRHDLVLSEARQAAAMGYHAKACIHPDHVARIRAGFRPHPSEVAWATNIVEAATARGQGTDIPVFALGGQMVDSPVVVLAQRVLSASEDRKESG